MRRAVSRPMPRDAPVIRATRPERSRFVFEFSTGRVYGMNVEVLLYTRQACHLCEVAKAAMRTAISTESLPVRLTEIDIDSDPALQKRFTDDVPVIFVDGVEAFRHRVTADQFAARILGRTQGGPVLADEGCVPCRGGVPPLRGGDITELARQLGSGWTVREEHHLEKEFRFEDFSQGLAFTNRVGAVAEAEGHHPDILLSWGRVLVTIWTHKIDGLTRADFVLAAKIDRSL